MEEAVASTGRLTQPSRGFAQPFLIKTHCGGCPIPELVAFAVLHLAVCDLQEISLSIMRSQNADWCSAM
jgi:hypothetical protein